MTELFMAGCGIKICRWERDSLILTEGIRDIFKTVGGMRDENGKPHVTDVTRRTASLTRRDGGIEPKK